MSSDAFRGTVIAGVLISIVASRFNKIAGGVVSLIVTTVILLFGLDVYSRPGWTMTFFGIEVSEGIFLLMIAIWYFFDVKQIRDGLKERTLGKRLEEDMAQKLATGLSVKDTVKQVLEGLEKIDYEHKKIAARILDGKEYKDTILDLCSGSIVKDGSKADAVLAYQQAVDIVNTMLATAASQAENSGLPAQGKPLSYFLPALRVSQTGFISNFRKADLVYSYNGELVQTQKELEEQTSKTVSEKKVTIGVLRKDPRKGNVWTKVEVGAKGGPLELSLEENN